MDCCSKLFSTDSGSILGTEDFWYRDPCPKRSNEHVMGRRYTKHFAAGLFESSRALSLFTVLPHLYLLSPGGLHAHGHVSLDGFDVRTGVGQNTVPPGPVQKVELTYRRFVLLAFETKSDSLTSTERVEVPPSVVLEPVLVVRVHVGYMSRPIGAHVSKHYVVLFGVIRDKPVQRPQTHRISLRNQRNEHVSGQLIVEVVMNLLKQRESFRWKRVHREETPHDDPRRDFVRRFLIRFFFHVFHVFRFFRFFRFFGVFRVFQHHHSKTGRERSFPLTRVSRT